MKMSYSTKVWSPVKSIYSKSSSVEQQFIQWWQAMLPHFGLSPWEPESVLLGLIGWEVSGEISGNCGQSAKLLLTWGGRCCCGLPSMVLLAILTTDSLQVQMDIFYLFQLIARRDALPLLSASTAVPLHSSRLICGPLFFIAFEHLRLDVIIKASCLTAKATFALRSLTSPSECHQRMELPSTPSMRLFAFLPFLFLLQLLFVVRFAQTSVPVSSSKTRTNSNLLQTISIGFLSSFRYGQGKNIAGAIPLAIDHINAYAKLPFRKMCWVPFATHLMIDCHSVSHLI